MRWRARPRRPVCSLGQWDDELDEEARLAVEGRHYETGEKLALRRVKAAGLGVSTK